MVITDLVFMKLLVSILVIVYCFTDSVQGQRILLPPAISGSGLRIFNREPRLSIWRSESEGLSLIEEREEPALAEPHRNQNPKTPKGELNNRSPIPIKGTEVGL